MAVEVWRPRGQQRDALDDVGRILNVVGGAVNTYEGISGAMKRRAGAALEESRRDPNSDISKNTRSVFSQITGISLPETTSAEQVEKNSWIYDSLSKQKQMAHDKDLVRLKGQQEQQQKLATVAKDKMLPPDKVLSVNEGNAIPTMLQDIRSTIGSNQGAFGPVMGRLSALNPYNEKATTIDAQMRAAAQSFGRYMEDGVLRKEDEDKYRKMFPQLGDTPQVAKNKLDIVERLLGERQNSNIAALKQSGYDVSGVEKGLSVPKAPAILSSTGKNGDLIPDAVAGNQWGIRPGTIEDGHVYTGGNPAEAKSWIKVK